MDSDFCCLQRLVFSDYNEYIDEDRYTDLRSEPLTSVEPGVCFKFRFRLLRGCYVRLSDSSSGLEFLGWLPQQEMAFGAWIPWEHEPLSRERFPQILGEQLCELPLRSSSFLRLIDHAWSRLVRAVYCRPDAHYDVIEISCPVTIDEMHIHSAARVLEVVTRLSMETTQSYMNRAAESAMQSLKDVEVPADKMETCTVCLEEMKGVCRATAMPCSHVFHGDCIREWLRTSHYCPVCRFEMPTAGEEVCYEERGDLSSTS